MPHVTLVKREDKTDFTCFKWRQPNEITWVSNYWEEKKNLLHTLLKVPPVLPNPVPAKASNEANGSLDVGLAMREKLDTSKETVKYFVSMTNLSLNAMETSSQWLGSSHQLWCLHVCSKLWAFWYWQEQLQYFISTPWNVKLCQTHEWDVHS